MVKRVIGGSAGLATMRKVSVGTAAMGVSDVLRVRFVG